MSRWKRVHERFKLLSYQGTNIVYLRERKNHPAKRVLSTEELFDTLERLHKVEGDHPGRSRLDKRASQEFYGVTERVCGILVKTCIVCHLNKSNKSLKPLLLSQSNQQTNSAELAHVDLIDMSHLNLQANLSPDGVTPYRYLMVYLDHFTKNINLTPLKRKTGEEVTEALLDIFCESGPPHILHSDNGREFSNHLLFSTLAEKLPSIKIIHGKPRYPSHKEQ